MSKRPGFTLLELVVVVLILGILAAIVAPRAFRGSEEASESSLRQNLAVVRDAIDLYALEHDGQFPGATSDGTNPAGSEQAFKNQLLKYSNLAGQVSDTKSPSYPYGPYLRRSFPKAPVGKKRGEDTVKVVGTGTPLSGDDTTAWAYDYTTGEFILNSTDVANDGTTRYEQF